jgi:hypothetical protein
MTEVGRRYVPIRRTLKKASLPARVVLLADLMTAQYGMYKSGVVDWVYYADFYEDMETILRSLKMPLSLLNNFHPFESE